jgi:hypothetical protein
MSHFLGSNSKPPRKHTYSMTIYVNRQEYMFPWVWSSATKQTMLSLVVWFWPARKFWAAKAIRVSCLDCGYWITLCFHNRMRSLENSRQRLFLVLHLFVVSTASLCSYPLSFHTHAKLFMYCAIVVEERSIIYANNSRNSVRCLHLQL